MYINSSIDHNINPVKKCKIPMWPIFAYMNIFDMRTMILCHRNEKK